MVVGVVAVRGLLPLRLLLMRRLPMILPLPLGAGVAVEVVRRLLSPPLLLVVDVAPLHRRLVRALRPSRQAARSWRRVMRRRLQRSCAPRRPAASPGARRAARRGAAQFRGARRGHHRRLAAAPPSQRLPAVRHCLAAARAGLAAGQVVRLLAAPRDLSPLPPLLGPLPGLLPLALPWLVFSATCRSPGRGRQRRALPELQRAPPCVLSKDVLLLAASRHGRLRPPGGSREPSGTSLFPFVGSSFRLALPGPLCTRLGHLSRRPSALTASTR